MESSSSSRSYPGWGSHTSENCWNRRMVKDYEDAAKEKGRKKKES